MAKDNIFALILGLVGLALMVANVENIQHNLLTGSFWIGVIMIIASIVLNRIL